MTELAPTNALRIAIREVIAAIADDGREFNFEDYLQALADRGFGHVTFRDLSREMAAAEDDMQREAAQ